MADHKTRQMMADALQKLDGAAQAELREMAPDRVAVIEIVKVADVVADALTAVFDPLRGKARGHVCAELCGDGPGSLRPCALAPGHDGPHTPTWEEPC